MENALELVAFDKCTAIMEDGLNPDDITGRLFSRDMITPREKESINSQRSRFDKARDLVSAVRRHLVGKPSDFIPFVEIVEKEPAFSGVAKRLRGNQKDIVFVSQ